MPDVNPEDYREQLASLARRKECRGYGWPIHWSPRSVINPNCEFGLAFTDASAWEFIADHLEAGHPVEVITLDDPPGKTAFVMKIELEPNSPKLYIKLQFGSGKVIARSFHISTVEEKKQ